MDDFRVGDRVWDFQFGWGRINEIAVDAYPVGVYFDERPGIEWFSKDGKYEDHESLHRTLFFEEIPIPESAIKRPWTPEPGEWVAVKNSMDSCWHIREFVKQEDSSFVCKAPIVGNCSWHECRPLSSFNGDDK